MGRHMLTYHVAVPLAVFAALMLIGVPVSSAARAGIVIGCVSMVVMMVTGGTHHDHRPQSDDAASSDDALRAERR
jgi:hypothetical protein